MTFIEGMLDENMQVIPEKWAEFQAQQIALLEAQQAAPPVPTLESALEIIEQLEARVAELEA